MQEVVVGELQLDQAQARRPAGAQPCPSGRVFGSSPREVDDQRQGAQGRHAREVRDHRVSLHRDLAINLPLVLGDRVQLQQVIINLVLNAMEAMSSVTNRPRDLTIRSRQDADQVLVAVQDSGIPFISSLLNAGMMCGVLAIAAESVYIASRVLRSMAHQGLVSPRLAHVDDKGRPRLALVITCLIAVILGYIQLSGKSY